MQQGARHIVLAGRSAPSTHAREVIAELEAAGATVVAAQADIAREDDVTRLIGLCAKPLRGIVHAAGVLDDGILENQTAERFARVMAPKIHGAWHLHTQSRSQPLDFFVCFSSMASAMGAAGQINYAAANAFLDGLAQYRRARGLCGLSIDWGPWATVGMAADLSVAGQGVEKIEVEDGSARFWRAARQSTVGTGASRRVARQLAGVSETPAGGELPPYLSQLIRRPHAAVRTRGCGKRRFPARYRETPAAGRLALLESAICAELAEVLGLDVHKSVPATQPWAELGVDSLMMVELKIRLDRLLHVTLPVEKLVRDTNTHGLATFVADKLDHAGRADGEPVACCADAGRCRGAASRLRQLVDQIPQIFFTVDKQQRRQVLVGGRWRCDFASCNYLGLDLAPRGDGGDPAGARRMGRAPELDPRRRLAAHLRRPGTRLWRTSSERRRRWSFRRSRCCMSASFRCWPATTASSSRTPKRITRCTRAVCGPRPTAPSGSTFPHSDIDDLARKLAKYPRDRTKLIATDGVYSMGSSHPPLIEYVRLAKAYNATLYVDDAHGFGIIGERPDAELPYGYRGNGMVRHFGLDYVEDRIVYVAGMSKAFSSYAAFVTCFDDKMKYDLQASGPFVFSGPTCTASLASALAGLRVNARDGDSRRQIVYRLTKRLVTAVKEMGFEVDNGGVLSDRRCRHRRLRGLGEGLRAALGARYPDHAGVLSGGPDQPKSGAVLDYRGQHRGRGRSGHQGAGGGLDAAARQATCGKARIGEEPSLGAGIDDRNRPAPYFGHRGVERNRPCVLGPLRRTWIHGVCRGAQRRRPRNASCACVGQYPSGTARRHAAAIDRRCARRRRQRAAGGSGQQRRRSP